MKKIIFIFSLFLLFNCSDDEPLRTENFITLFHLEINGNLISGDINNENNSITFNLTDADITSLIPKIKISDGASISPQINTPQNFNNNIRYTVTAENGIEREYVVIVNNKILSSENLVTLFQLNINNQIYSADIEQQTGNITLDLVGAELNNLVPNIKISDKATIFPNPNIAQDFRTIVNYTVTAENGEQKSYQVNIKNRPFNTEKKIINFKVGLNGENIEARLDEDQKTISFETGSLNISRLTPEIIISENASISPASGEIVDFTNPVIYTVTAENGETTEYEVKINKAYEINAQTAIGPRTGAQLLFTRGELFITLSFLNPSITDAEIFLNDGVNETKLSVDKLETYENQRVLNYVVTTKIPENTITSNNYNIVYKLNDLIVKSDVVIDVLAENSPKINSINQNSYSFGDNLIITGENLTDFIGVRSNGSFYLFNPAGSVDVELNPEKTEYLLKMNNSFSRSAFFPYDAVTRNVIFLGPNNRTGDQVRINVN
ncbi:DUF5018 domain-containing protein [uncultured Tenacibaculum sp.]|uniref:DUF5018 domain-containing protein n=1 Tax=uncultured Tenacibaculum sp. TaxID=174713 RepID=UPI00262189E9|nr:DUF5018 domain-containing protein [uncultured Tenacibaculum sp.]